MNNNTIIFRMHQALNPFIVDEIKRKGWKGMSTALYRGDAEKRFLTNWPSDQEEGYYLWLTFFHEKAMVEFSWMPLGDYGLKYCEGRAKTSHSQVTFFENDLWEAIQAIPQHSPPPAYPSEISGYSIKMGTRGEAISVAPGVLCKSILSFTFEQVKELYEEMQRRQAE